MSGKLQAVDWPAACTGSGARELPKGSEPAEGSEAATARISTAARLEARTDGQGRAGQKAKMRRPIQRRDQDR